MSYCHLTVEDRYVINHQHLAGKSLREIGEAMPAEVATRTRFGDWESDSINGQPGTGGIATHVERVSRFIVAAKIEDKTATRFVTVYQPLPRFFSSRMQIAVDLA